MKDQQTYRNMLLAVSALSKARTEIDRAIAACNALADEASAEPVDELTDETEEATQSPSGPQLDEEHDMRDVCNYQGHEIGAYCDLWEGHENLMGHFFRTPRARNQHIQKIPVGFVNNLENVPIAMKWWNL